MGLMRIEQPDVLPEETVGQAGHAIGAVDLAKHLDGCVVLPVDRAIRLPTGPRTRMRGSLAIGAGASCPASIAAMASSTASTA